MGPSNRCRTGSHAKAALRTILPANLDAERLAAALDRAGFVIVPKLYTKPARRGNAVTPDPGPWLGKSHTANLIGG